MEWTDVTRLQAGLITKSQLRACGIASGTSDGWLAAGRLHATETHGVYRLGGAPPTPSSNAWYAVLSSRSPLSFVSAALWLEFPVEDDGLVHITRFARRRLDWPPGVRVHRVAITRGMVERNRGLWTTTGLETILDCLGYLPYGRARALGDRAIQQSWITPVDVVRRLDEWPGRWGNRQLRRLLAGLTDGADAESERRMHRLLRQAGISGWVSHLPFVVAGQRFEIDIAFPQSRLAIEIDGFRYHSADARFQRDRTKQNVLMGAGWRVLRFTWKDIVERPAEVVRQITALLAA